MRVTDSMLQQTLLADTQRARLRLARTQEQASSGLRINRPSDDPAGASRALALRGSLEEAAQLGRNIGQADGRLAATDSALEESSQVLIRARELAIQGATDTLDASSRRLLAEEIATLHDRLLAAGNRRTGGAHLFAGFASDAPPFSRPAAFGAGPPAPAVSFVGDSNEIEIEAEPGTRLATTLDGRRVFLGDGDGDGSPDAGREDLFDVIGDLWEALVNDDPVAVRGTLDRIDRGQQQLLGERAKVGSRLTRLEAARSERERLELELRTELSKTEDADSFRVYSELVQQETLLQASLEATARAVQPSLLDFLR